MTGNVLLAARIAAEGQTQQELADALNLRIAAFTGRLGTVTDRHIRNWLTGKTRSPRARQRRALEEQFGCSAAELGFASTASRSAVPARPNAPEAPVRRRTFAGTAAAVAAAAALPPSPNRTLRVGMTDAIRLETAFAELVAADNHHGGTITLETRALAFAHHASELQSVGHASQRVRARLYYLAAAFTGTAVWAAIDAHEPDRAQQHLDRAMTLAGLAGSTEMYLRLWSHASALALQQQRHRDAIAAAEAGRATSVCRRDPLLRSLAAARLAGVQAKAGERRSALRNLDVADRAFARADPALPRPTWAGFYDQSELSGLSALTMARIGEHEQAEARLHRTLAQLRPEYMRNRLYYSAHLALAQLHQNDVEQACSTATSVLPLASGDSLTGRTRQLFTTFTRELSATAPSAPCTVQWRDQFTSTRGGHL
jgi:transcriptional regulator with XRE-family HTH domain